MEKSRKPRKEKLSVLKKKLDIEFSKYVRALEKGICYTCGVQKSPKEMQAGHYISRTCLALRWCLDNVHCQCYACNCMKHGDLITYREKLVAQYGEDVVTGMESRRHYNCTFSSEWYHAYIDKYKALNKEYQA